MSEINKFFEGLPSEDKQATDIFNDKPAETPEVVPEKGEDEPKSKDRRYRRLEQKLQEERESNIALAERIRVLAELKEEQKSNKDESFDPELIELFGDNEAGKRVAQIFEKKLQGVSERAKQEALEELSKAQSYESELVNEYSNQIDEEFANIEDKYDVDLSGNDASSKKLRELYVNELQRRSHKDKDGNIDSYPDFEATFEDVLEKVKPDNTRNKEIADKSMVRSGQSSPKEEDDSNRAYLRSLGIRV